jgi:hypothetical protein
LPGTPLNQTSTPFPSQSSLQPVRLTDSFSCKIFTHLFQDSSESSVQDILTGLFTDLKDAKLDLEEDLTQGLDGKNPLIKDILPNPTGVEVRGQERDIPPVSFEPTQQEEVSQAKVLRSLNGLLLAVTFIALFL